MLGIAEARGETKVNGGELGVIRVSSLLDKVDGDLYFSDFNAHSIARSGHIYHTYAIWLQKADFTLQKEHDVSPQATTVAICKPS